MNKEILKKLMGFDDFRNPRYIVELTIANYYGVMGYELWLTPDSPKGKYGYRVSTECGDENGLLEVMVKLVEQCSKLKLTSPTDKDQRYNKGYCTQSLGNNQHVRWKRKNDLFYVTDIFEMDDIGFVTLERPCEPTAYRNAQPFTEEVRVRDYEYIDPNGINIYNERIFSKIVLKDGETLWCYNDLAPLSGSAGLLIVKDGLVVKHYGVFRA